MAKLQLHEQIDYAHAKLQKLLPNQKLDIRLNARDSSITFLARVPNEKFAAIMKKLNAPNVTLDGLRMKKALEQDAEESGQLPVSPQELRAFAHEDTIQDHLRAELSNEINVHTEPKEETTDISITMYPHVTSPKEQATLNGLANTWQKVKTAQLELVKKAPALQETADTFTPRPIQHFGFTESDIRIEKTTDGRLLAIQPIRRSTSDKGIKGIATVLQRLEKQRKMGKIGARLTLAPTAQPHLQPTNMPLLADEEKDKLSNPQFRAAAHLLRGQTHAQTQAIYFYDIRPHVQQFELVHEIPKTSIDAAKKLHMLQQKLEKIKHMIANEKLPIENIS